ncbi:MAG: SRPBCC family protein [Chthonomonas sp.]|nr:SRPBCC family protein [Chthonomonas sp.]
MRTYTLNREVVVPAPLDEVFEFFSNADNLEKLTPASLRFKILTNRPIEMKPGALIEYQLRLLGVPFRWLTEITVWEPGIRFIDVQRKGPYLLWEHEHGFRAKGSSTVVTDSLRYAVPGGPLAPMFTRLFVRGQVERIFEYRSRAIAQLFGSENP